MRRIRRGNKIAVPITPAMIDAIKIVETRGFTG
jgi:hypothetical protein